MGNYSNVISLLKNALPKETGADQYRKAGSAFVIIAMGMAIGFVSQILVARLAGAENYGVYAYVYAWLQILAFVPRLGFENGLMKYLAAYIATKKWGLVRGIVSQAYAMVLAVSVFLSSILALLVFFFRDVMSADVVQAMWFGCLGLPFFALVVIGSGALKGLKRVVQSQLSLILFRWGIFGLFAIVAYLFGRSGISGAEVLAYDVAALILVTLISGYWVLRGLPPKVRTVRPRYATRVWLKTSIPMGVGLLLQFVVQRLDIIFVGLLLAADSTGAYAAAARVASLAIFGLRAAEVMAAPLIAQHYARGEFGQLQAVVTRTCRMTTLFTLFLSLIVLPAPGVILGLFGNEFRVASLALIILFIGQVVNSLTGPVGYLLSMTAYEREMMYLDALSVLLIIISLPVGIHFWGIIGAALATSIVLATLNISRWILVKRKIGIVSLPF